MSKFSPITSEKGNNLYRDIFGELYYQYGKYIASNNGVEPPFLVLHLATHEEYINKLETYDINPPGANKNGLFFFNTLIITTSMIQPDEFFFVG